VPGSGGPHPTQAGRHPEHAALGAGRPLPAAPCRDRMLRRPEFAIWCGTELTRDWHQRFRAAVVVHGHRHIPTSRWHDGSASRRCYLATPRVAAARPEPGRASPHPFHHDRRAGLTGWTLQPAGRLPATSATGSTWKATGSRPTSTTAGAQKASPTVSAALAVRHRPNVSRQKARGPPSRRRGRTPPATHAPRAPRPTPTSRPARA
jgi:hypothetical protein